MQKELNFVILNKSEIKNNHIDILYIAARQCYYKGFAGEFETSTVSYEDKVKLVTNVMQMGHTSFLQHCSVNIALEGLSRSFSHQLVRHSTHSHSQQSQRYVDAADFDYVVPHLYKKHQHLEERFHQCMNNVTEDYEWFRSELEKLGYPSGVCNENAREVLPNAAETKIVETANYRSLLNFFEHRCCSRAQTPIREFACLLLKELSVLSPIFNAMGAKCYTQKKCSEGKLSCGEKWTDKNKLTILNSYPL